MNVLIPVSRYQVKYQVASGRPFSFFERLVLEGIGQGLKSIEHLTTTFQVHQRVIIEVVVNLMQTGWVAINRDNQNIIVTSTGRAALRRDETLPTNIVVQDRIGYVVGERVVGQVASSADVTFVSRQSLKTRIDQVAKLYPSDIPHPLDPGILSPHLSVRDGEWIRTIGDVTILRNSSDFVVVNVDKTKKVTGLPPAWKRALEWDVIDAAERKEKELIYQNIKFKEDGFVNRYVRNYTLGDHARLATDSLDDPELRWVRLEKAHDHLVLGKKRMLELVTKFLGEADFVFIAIPSLTIKGVREWSELLVEAQRRGALVSIVVGEPTVESSFETNFAIQELRDLCSIAEEEKDCDYQPLIIGKGPSHHESMVVIADMGHSIEALVGSQAWLNETVADECEPPLLLAMHFIEPQLVSHLARLVVNLATADEILVQGFISPCLQNIAEVLDKKEILEKAARNEEEPSATPMEFDELEGDDIDEYGQQLKKGDLVARILVGTEYQTALSSYSNQAKLRLIVAGGQWPSSGIFVEVLKRAAEKLCPRVEVHYLQESQALTKIEGLTGKEENTTENLTDLKAMGVLTYHHRALPGFAVLDDSRATILGFNWLSRRDDKKPNFLSTEIGIEIQGGDLVSRLMAGMGIPEKREESAKLSCAYVKSFFVKGLRSIREVSWELSETDNAPGWHVLIGDNGSGKSTILRALALALMGPQYSNQLKPEWMQWVRDGETLAKVEVNLIHGNTGGVLVPSKVVMTWTVESSGMVMLDHHCDEQASLDVVSMGYGALRRFGGNNGKEENKYGEQKAIARHISLFDYQTLTSGISWLIKLHHHALSGDAEKRMLLAQVMRLINQCNLFPSGVYLSEISPDGLIFSDDQKNYFTFMDLSEGYHTILGITVDIIRNLSDQFGPSLLFDPANPDIVIAPAIVLIDEVDAHLHPTWQQNIGPWLIQHFPNIQFIVTTHSPLICQAADKGTIFRLPGVVGLEEQETEAPEAELLRGNDKDRLIYGNMVEAFGSKSFGHIRRSKMGEEKLNRLATLNLLELEKELSEDEKQEQLHLRAVFPTTAYNQTTD